MATYPGFEGDIEKWYFECGDEGVIQIDPEAPCEDESYYCNVVPDECVDLYEECDYQGRHTKICND